MARRPMRTAGHVVYFARSEGLVGLRIPCSSRPLAFALGPKDEVKKFQVAWDKVVDEDETGDLKFSDLFKKAIKGVA